VNEDTFDEDFAKVLKSLEGLGANFTPAPGQPVSPEALAHEMGFATSGNPTNGMNPPSAGASTNRGVASAGKTLSPQDELAMLRKQAESIEFRIAYLEKLLGDDAKPYESPEEALDWLKQQMDKTWVDKGLEGKQ
jgi:hypothetical protein